MELIQNKHISLHRVCLSIGEELVTLTINFRNHFHILQKIKYISFWSRQDVILYPSKNPGIRNLFLLWMYRAIKTLRCIELADSIVYWQILTDHLLTERVLTTWIYTGLWHATGQFGKEVTFWRLTLLSRWSSGLVILNSCPISTS